MKIYMIATVAAFLTGCSSSSGVLRTGQAFTITTTASPGAGGATTAKKNAYSEAAGECEHQGKKVQITSENATPPSWTDGMHTITLAFECN